MDHPFVTSSPLDLRLTQLQAARAAFQSEMTSPVTHHRLMATPKSVLRPTPSKFQLSSQKSGGGFRAALFSLASATILASPTTVAASPRGVPGTLKRKVAFNDEVFIQEIVDIRDKRIHWNAKVDGAEAAAAALSVRMAASVPLPDSPAVSRSVRFPVVREL